MNNNNYEYIIRFLQSVENIAPKYKPIQKGYVPIQNGKALGNSGVTIATGVDLGQQDENRLKKNGLSQDIINKLIPYLGLKKEKAINKIKESPLILTENEVFEIDSCIMSLYILEAKSIFNNYIKEKKDLIKFEDRPKQLQAVVVSLYYQLGTKGLKNYLNTLTLEDYTKAIIELKSQSTYKYRRNKEAELLQEV